MRSFGEAKFVRLEEAREEDPGGVLQLLEDTPAFPRPVRADDAREGFGPKCRYALSVRGRRRVRCSTPY